MDSAALPSRVEESLAACPQFRILVVGNTGVGKSTLISKVFNLGENDINIAHINAGKANISFGYQSITNPRFILHDSEGFEPGTSGHWEAVRRFLCERSISADVQGRVHAIWMCITAPRAGMRLHQTGDENLIALAKGLGIPLIVVFTKFDLLVVEHKRKMRFSLGDPRAKAEQAIEARIADDHALPPKTSWVRISTKSDFLETLTELTEATRQSLFDVEHELYLTWATAQQVNARQKVEQSIKYVNEEASTTRKAAKEQYWLDLGRSTVFKGQMLGNCVWRIFDDVLKVWNFHDPQHLLYMPQFFAKTLKLVEDFTPHNEAATGDSKTQDIMTVVSAIGGTFAQAMGAIGLSILAIKFLHNTYQAMPQTACFLGAYIIDLTLVLHHIFLTTLPTDPPRPLTMGIIDDAVKVYETRGRAANHQRIRAIGIGNFEQQVTRLVEEALR